MNKKAQAVGIFGIVVYVVVALIVILFFGLFVVYGCVAESQKPVEIKTASQDVDLNLVLANTLRTPVFVDGANVTIVELGMLTLYNSTYNSVMENELRLMFEELPYLYALKITKGNRIRILGNANVGVYGTCASAEIPSQDFGIVEFRLCRLTPEELVYAMAGEAGYY